MRILVGLSGGADSAAVALKLLREGADVVGVFLRLFEGAEDSAARFVADKLAIPLEVVEAKEAFEECVISDFVSEYARGRTPNPCALCNREMKIRLLCEAAARLGCEKVATGHYAKIGEDGGRLFVKAGKDAARDQSYFLWRLTQEQLSKLDFVLAEEEKRQILPEVQGLLPPGTRESREVCFIPRDDRVAFLEKRLPESAKKSGDFVNDQGAVLARHNGVFRYTVGQRRGFGVGFGRRVYVKAIEAEEARVILSDKQSCETDSCRLSALNFQRLKEGEGEWDVLCRVRYRAPLVCARLRVSDGTAEVTLSDGARAVFAPGQSLVCYDREGAVLCGGVIEPETGKNSSVIL